ncbi:MAG TPA: inositol monophosphatase family protein [Methylomirabilota bacterium]|nr:inositol monophosphatase family protein [Methylomirabilota bacterium]
MTTVQARLVQDFARFAHELLDDTDALALRYFEAGLTASLKGDRTLVTRADTEIERAIRDRIGDRFPDHGLLGEEYGAEATDAAMSWIIDPIDATNNFVRGIGVFATLLACRIDGELVLGLVSAPAMRERWWAISTEGAWRRRNGGERRIGVSSVSSLADSHLLYGGARSLAGRVAAASAYTWRDRGFGDFWGHMLVAGGSAEGMVEDGVAAWDMAAPHVIVTAAGGRMTNLEGAQSWTDPQLLTSNGLVHEQLLELLRS